MIFPQQHGRATYKENDYTGNCKVKSHGTNVGEQEDARRWIRVEFLDDFISFIHAMTPIECQRNNVMQFEHLSRVNCQHNLQRKAQECTHRREERYHHRKLRINKNLALAHRHQVRELLIPSIWEDVLTFILAIVL